jgi:hypothetical protein
MKKTFTLSHPGCKVSISKIGSILMLFINGQAEKKMPRFLLFCFPFKPSCHGVFFWEWLFNSDLVRGSFVVVKLSNVFDGIKRVFGGAGGFWLCVAFASVVLEIIVVAEVTISSNVEHGFRNLTIEPRI